MAALDFPDTPAVGAIYGTWRWDGFRWASTSGPSGARGRVAYSQVVVNQSGIGGTQVNLGGMVASWVADPSRTYRTTVRGEVTGTVAGTVPVVHVLDAVGAGKQRWTMALSTTNAFSVHAEVVETGLSGPQTRQAALSNVAGGTLTWGASAAFPAFVLVEDITLEQGSPATPGTPTQAAATAILAAATWGPAWTQATFASAVSSDNALIVPGSAGFTVTKAGVYLVSVNEAYNVTIQNNMQYTYAYARTDKPGITTMFEMLGGMNQAYGTLSGSAVWQLQAGAQVWIENYCSNGGAALRVTPAGVLSIAKVA